MASRMSTQHYDYTRRLPAVRTRAEVQYLSYIFNRVRIPRGIASEAYRVG
jgi:hypothetical protein